MILKNQNYDIIIFLKSLCILIDWYGKEEKENNVLFVDNNMKEDIYKKNKSNGESKISSSTNLIPPLKKQFFLFIKWNINYKCSFK